jgi:L-ascorbate 6-phosphate lactonase
MGRGEYYEVRLGKPLPPADLRSEWFEWFLKDVNQYRPKQGSVVLWALGGAGFVLKTPMATIYIDPYVGGSVESEGAVFHRMIPIPFNASSVREIDAAVITHEDLDHMDENFIFPVNTNTKCQFVGPPSVAELLESWKISQDRIVSLEENQTAEIRDTTIAALPSNDTNAKTANTYLFETGDVRIFHSGDSLHLAEFAEIGKRHRIDIAAISFGRNPSGSKWYNEAGEALQIARDLNAKVLIPMHWDLWYGTLEDPHLVELEAERKGLDLRVVPLRIGERFVYP